MKKLGLDVPQATELAYRLRKKASSFLTTYLMKTNAPRPFSKFWR